MKKLTLFLFLTLLLTSLVISQTSWIKIYSDDTTTLGIAKLNSIKLNGLNTKQIYIQRGYINNQTPNENGKFLKLNKTNNTWYTPANGFLNTQWCYCGSCFPPQWQFEMVFSFAMSPIDSQFIIMLRPSCGIDGGDQTYITYNNGLNFVNLPQFSNSFEGEQNNGYDIDPINDNIIYFAYPIISSGIRCVFRSTNRGLNWIATDTNASLYWQLLKINPFKRTNIFVDGSANLMMSTNSGSHFFSVNVPHLSTLTFDIIDSSIYGTANNNIFKSTNSGYNWTSIASGTFNCIEISAINHNTVYAGSVNGLYRSDDGGQTWNLFNDSFTPSKRVIGLSMDLASGDTVYAATTDAVYKVWGSYIVSVKNLGGVIPEKFSLEQNYPNPFNPATRIKFSVPSVGNGRDRSLHLKIYDILGREVATLVNEQLQPGTYSMEWNAEGFASGIYFYSLTTDEFSQTKKMVLLK